MYGRVRNADDVRGYGGRGRAAAARPRQRLDGRSGWSAVSAAVGPRRSSTPQRQAPQRASFHICLHMKALKKKTVKPSKTQ